MGFDLMESQLFIKSSDNYILQKLCEQNKFQKIVNKILEIYCSHNNTFAIPTYSISYLLLLIYTGSLDNTQTELNKLLNLQNETNLVQFYQNVIQINRNINCRGIKFINTLFVNNINTINKTFLEFSKTCELNLFNKSINNFIKTMNYFGSNWENKFNVKNTYDTKFLKQSKQINIKMMHQHNSFKYYETNIYQSIELPYENGDFVMNIILPKINSSNSILTMDNITAIIINSSFQQIDLHIPKFTLNYKTNIAEILKQNGINDLFNDKCNLTKLSTDNFHISEITCETIIDMNESCSKCEFIPNVDKQKLILFKCDKPFYYIFRQKSTGMILLAGLYDG